MADIQYDGQTRSRYVNMAKYWTERQASRLGYTPAEVLAAVRRGWTAEDIEALAIANAEWLALTPGQATGAKIQAAPVLPVNQRVYFMDAHDRYVTKAKRAA